MAIEHSEGHEAKIEVRFPREKAKVKARVKEVIALSSRL